MSDHKKALKSLNKAIERIEEERRKHSSNAEIYGKLSDILNELNKSKECLEKLNTFSVDLPKQVS